MNFRLEMPFVRPSVTRVRLSLWNIIEQDVIDYGEQVCEVVIEDYLLSRRPNARQLVADGGRGVADGGQERVPHEGAGYQALGRDVVDRYRVIASDRAVLGQRCALEGDLVQIGDLLALFRSEEPSQGDSEVDSALFRVVLDPVESD